MASKKEYLDFVLDQLSGLEGISYRAMMGEYLLYYNDKLFGGIYDDRFLVKVTASSLELLPDAPQEMPYDGAKPMLLVTETEDKNYLRELILTMYEDLSETKKKLCITDLLMMSPQRLQLWINIWKIMDTAMTLAMTGFTMRYICLMQERLLLRSGRL